MVDTRRPHQALTEYHLARMDHRPVITVSQAAVVLSESNWAAPTLPFKLPSSIRNLTLHLRDTAVVADTAAEVGIAAVVTAAMLLLAHMVLHPSRLPHQTRTAFHLSALHPSVLHPLHTFQLQYHLSPTDHLSHLTCLPQSHRAHTAYHLAHMVYPTKYITFKRDSQFHTYAQPFISPASPNLFSINLILTSNARQCYPSPLPHTNTL